MSYEQMMAAARDWIETKTRIVQKGSESWRDSFYENRKDFWHHYGIVTGTNTTEQADDNFFCCNC